MNSNSLKNPKKSLPFNWYYDQKTYRNEINKIFDNEWIYFSHVDSIKPKHYRTLKIDNKNIVIIKDQKENISVFFNTCMHRGSQIFGKEEGKMNSQIIICPYHQWSYKSSNGELINTTSMKYKNFSKKEYGLKRVNYHIWNGLIFINLNNKKKFNKKNVFQYYDKTFEKLKLDNFVTGHIWKKRVKCNWKIYWENYSECLHCPNIHPELSDLVPLYQRRLVDIKDHPEWSILKDKNSNPKFQGGLKKGSQTWSSDGSAQGHLLDSVKDELESKGQIYISTWPSMFLGVYGDHVRIVRLILTGPEEVELTAEWLFEKGTLNDPNYKKTNVIDFGILVMKQDADIAEINQKGLYNLGTAQGVLMPEEYIIHEFQKYIKKKMRTFS
tara:strand:- start:469 stop:1617 length:1149 start_codon:yes stop_codon:yes gene_type:complete